MLPFTYLTLYEASEMHDVMNEHLLEYTNNKEFIYALTKQVLNVNLMRRHKTTTKI